MIETFLRRPARAGEYAADAIRALIVLSVIVAGFGWGLVQVGLFLLTLLGALVPRALGVRPALDVATGLVLLVAAWSSVLDLYTRFLGWDKVVHILLTGLLAALATIAAQRAGLLPSGREHSIGLAVVTVAFGIAAGAVWEGLEWAGHTLAVAPIFVSYDDTIGDLAADAFGALLAGLALPFLAGPSANPAARRSEAEATSVTGRT